MKLKREYFLEDISKVVRQKGRENKVLIKIVKEVNKKDFSLKFVFSKDV